MTYRVGAAASAACVSFVLSLGWVAWQVHGGQSHGENSVNQQTFDAHKDYIVNRLDRQETKLDRVLETLQERN